MFYKRVLSPEALAALDEFDVVHNANKTGTTPDDDMDMLAALMLSSKSTRVLQFGTFLGGSSIVLADLAKQNAAANPDGPAPKFVTVDPSETYNETAMKWLEKSGARSFSKPALAFSTDPGLIRALKPHTWDFIFLDTTHQYFDTVEEIKAISTLCSDHTVWTFHDASIFAADTLDERHQGGVNRAIREFVAVNPQWQHFIFESKPFGLYGIGLMMRKNMKGI